MLNYSQMPISVGILGTGKCLPDKILTNSDLEKMVDTTEEWILKRTGIHERRILDENTPLYELGIKAAKKALLDAGLSPELLDLIIVTTESPDYLTPSMSCLIQNGIGAKKAAAFDLNAACTGTVYGLTVAQQFIFTGCYKYVLVVSCESLSRIVDWEDRSTCVLFGDGAAAMVVGEVEKGYGFLASNIGAAGELGHYLTVPCCYLNDEEKNKRSSDNKMVIWMDGGEVFKFAVKVMVDATKDVMDQAGLTMDDIKMIVPHQANIRIIDNAAKKLNISTDKIFTTLHKYGNISSASIPVAFDDCIKEGLVTKGDNIVLVGFGGGLTWASTLIKWSKE